MSPERVFQILTAAGLIAGGWFYGEYWKNSAAEQSELAESSSLRAENSDLTLKIDELEDELEKARSIIAKGPYPVPEELIAWVEQDYNMVFLKPADIISASPAAIRDAAETNLIFVHGEEGLKKESQAWELLGLLPQSQQILGQLIMINSSVKGIFDLTKEQILISEDFDPASVPDRAVLAKLLAQQLSFQNYPQREWNGRDEWQAWEAVHVGSAAALSARFLRRVPDAQDGEYIDPEPMREKLLNDLPPIIQGLSNFPYIEGADCSRFHYIDSRNRFGEMFKNPAKTTAEIFHPNRDPMIATEIIFRESAAKLVVTNQLGELGLRLWLEPFAGVLEAGPLSQEWRGDAYEVRDLNGETTLTWHIEMATEQAARSLKAEVERSLITPVKESQPKREIHVSQFGTRMTFINTTPAQ